MTPPRGFDGGLAGDGDRLAGRRRKRRPSPTLAALLSFLWPGLGELYLGRLLRAALLAVPAVLALAWLIVLAKDGLTSLAFQLLDPTQAGVLLALVVITGLLRVISVADAFLLAKGPSHVSTGSWAAMAVLVAAALGAHGIASWYASSFLAAGQAIFGGDTAVSTPAPSGAAASGSPGSSSSTDINPFTGGLPPPATQTSRINILLLGADSGLGYRHSLTDSQILVSIDPAKRTVVMASIPRDLAQFPMYSGGTYQGKINSLMSTAGADPADYPDGGIGTLAREVGYLLGVPVNYYAFINLQGFQQMIDAVGGVDVVNPAVINDPGFGFGDGTKGFFLPAGPQHLDARTGLAFVRSRMGAGDNDYTRARRQQLVLQAIRDKLTSPSMLPKIPAILNALAQTIKTDFPASRIAEMLGLSQGIPDSAIAKVVLGPPYSTNPPMSETGGIWLLRPDMAKIKAWSIRAFGPDSAYYVAPAGASPTTPPG